MNKEKPEKIGSKSSIGLLNSLNLENIALRTENKMLRLAIKEKRSKDLTIFMYGVSSGLFLSGLAYISLNL